MTQENEMNRDVDDFETDPNMVPGEVEAARQYDPSQGPVRSSGMKAKLLLVAAALLFAGGWGYANKEDFKNALGIQSKTNQANLVYSNEDIEHDHACCPAMMAALTDDHEACQTGTCPLTAQANAEAEKETCCEDGRKKAMVAALLKGTDKKEDKKEQESPKEEAANKTENSSEKSTTTDSKEEPAQGKSDETVSESDSEK